MKYLNIAALTLLPLVSSAPTQSSNPKVINPLDAKTASNMKSQLGLSKRSDFEGTVSAWIGGDGNCFGTSSGDVINPGSECWTIVSNGIPQEIWSFQMNPSDSNVVTWTLYTYSDARCTHVLDNGLNGGGEVCLPPSPGVYSWKATS